MAFCGKHLRAAARGEVDKNLQVGKMWKRWRLNWEEFECWVRPCDWQNDSYAFGASLLCFPLQLLYEPGTKIFPRKRKAPSHPQGLSCWYNLSQERQKLSILFKSCTHPNYINMGDLPQSREVSIWSWGNVPPALVSSSFYGCRRGHSELITI